MTKPIEGPGFHTYTVGTAEVVVLADGYRRFPLPDGLVANAAREDVNRALAAAGMPADEMTIHFNPVLVRTAGKSILIDTGNGAAAAAEEASTRGLLMASLAAAGIAPSEIDVVVISHFHPDHVNGLVNAEGAPAFPGAAVLVPEPEWRFWMEEVPDGAVEDRIKRMAEPMRAVFAPVRDRISQYAWDAALAPGLTAMATPGHTPGHTSFAFESENESVIIQSDVTNNPALFVRHPGWHAAFDMDGDKAEAARRALYDMLCDRKLPVQGFHFPFPGFAYVRRDGDGYRLTDMP